LRDLTDKTVALTEEMSAIDRLVVWTKSDLVDESVMDLPESEMAISNTSGSGIDSLLKGISDRLSRLTPSHGTALPTRERHIIHLKQCLNALQAAVLDTGAPLEIRSEHLRGSAQSLGKITGTVDVEQLLGVIFSEFCVGK